MKTQLQKILEDCGYNTRSYSGRCMYGKECLGVVIESNVSLFKLGVEVALGDWEGSDPFDSDIDNCQEDSMGFDKIVYWPNIEYSEEE